MVNNNESKRTRNLSNDFTSAEMKVSTGVAEMTIHDTDSEGIKSPNFRSDESPLLLPK